LIGEILLPPMFLPHFEVFAELKELK